MRRALPIVFTCLAIACGGSSSQAEHPTAPVVEDAPEPEAERPPKGSLWRDEVDATIEQGLGSFLQRVDLEPSLSEGRFRGFRIVELRPRDFWAGVDLKPGDVVTRVNDMPIERETEAYEAFVSLKKSDSLRVRYLRAGEEQELVFKIVDRPTAAPPSARPKQDAPKASTEAG